jgi:Ca2+/Na+ antiporter
MKLELFIFIIFGYSIVNYLNINVKLFNLILNYDNLDPYSQLILVSIIITIVIILLIFISLNRTNLFNLTTLIYLILMVIYCCCFDKFLSLL